MHKDILIRSRDPEVTLTAMVISAAANKGTVILCHGRNETKETFTGRYFSLINKLLEKGVNIVAFDFRGHGRSTPAVFSYGYFEQNDVLGIIDFVRSSQLNHENLGILGFSLGAAAAMLAAEKTKGIKALVSESGYSSLESVALAPGPDGKPLKKGSPEHKAYVDAFKKLMRWDFDIAPIDEIEKISPCALFLIDGKYEEPDNLLMFNKAKDPKQLWIIPGAFHGQVYGMARDEYDVKVADFFTEHLMD